jgi:antitoxin (DNA-binding transcriptional repressor) of toxin-antitoxin stability system
MKEVGVKEFRDHATAYLSAGEPLAVSKHGHVIGFYLPVKRDQQRIDRAFDRLAETVRAIREETGMSEEELAQFFDLNRPLPE